MQHKVGFLQHIVAQQSARLPFASHVSHPVESVIGIITALGQPVFQITPVGIHHHQSVVAYAFGLGYLVAVHACLPSPFALEHTLGCRVVEHDSILKQRKPLSTLALGCIPLHRGSHGHAVGTFRRTAFAIFAARLTSHAPVGTSQIAYGSVARAVGKELCSEPQALAAQYVSGCNACYARPVHDHTVGMHPHKETHSVLLL